MARPLCVLLALLCCLSPGLAAPGPGPGQLTTFVKKTATADSADYPDYQAGVKYDEYPVVVPKRAAVLLDRIMVALQKAVDEDSTGNPRGLVTSPVADHRQLMEPSMMDLERRNRKEGGRVYWRCYFNAVTCF